MMLSGTARSLLWCQPAPSSNEEDQKTVRGTVFPTNDDVGVRRAGRGDLIEKDLHRLGVDGGKHQGDILAGGRTDRGEDIGPFVAELLDARRAFTTPPPEMAEPTLVADARFIFEPQLHLLVWMGCGYCGDPIGKPPFLKAASASISRFGW